MTAQEEAKRRWSIERLNRIAALPESQRIIAKYGDHIHRDVANLWHLTLGFMCVMRASGKIQRSEFYAILPALSKEAKIPLKDLKVIAKLQLAMTEAMLLGSGEMPVSIKGGHDEQEMG